MATIIADCSDIMYLSETLYVSDGKVLPFYGSLADAENYFRFRLDNDPWLEASRDRKIAALAQATRGIDRLSYIGTKTGALEFPRDFQTEVPVEIKQACYEDALALLDGIDPNTETDNLVSNSQGYGSLRTHYVRDYQTPHRVNGIASATAWRLLAPFLADGESVALSRVS